MATTMAIGEKISRYWDWAKGAKDIAQYLIWLSTLIGGGGLIVYLGSITTWAVWLGPLGWALIAVGAMLFVSIAYYLWTLASTQRSIDTYVRAKIEARGLIYPSSIIHSFFQLKMFTSRIVNYWDQPASPF
jgi:hypothetical protein